MARLTMIGSRIAKLSGKSIPMPPKQRAAIYATDEHTAWAKAIRDRAQGRCDKCGREGARLYADHIVELKDGGTYDLMNGQALCGSCHTAKTLAARRKRFGLA